MKSAFFIAGPTAVGKSELAVDVALEVGAEIVNADAFQLYQGFDVLTAKPDAIARAKVRHHLLSTIPPSEDMNVDRFRAAAVAAIEDIQSRKKLAIVVGGSGLYLKSITHGLSDMPGGDARLRREFGRLTLDELRARLLQADPEIADKIDLKNRRRLERALEICLLTGKPVSAQRTRWKSAPETPDGVFVFRDRDELYRRINLRVEAMMEQGAVAEVGSAVKISATASQMIGLREVRKYLSGNLSLPQCVAEIQQATRQYAKRQLTWFRHQTNLEPLNLSRLSHNQAVEWVSRRALARRGEG